MCIRRQVWCMHDIEAFVSSMVIHAWKSQVTSGVLINIVYADNNLYDIRWNVVNQSIDTEKEQRERHEDRKFANSRRTFIECLSFANTQSTQVLSLFIYRALIKTEWSSCRPVSLNGKYIRVIFDTWQKCVTIMLFLTWPTKKKSCRSNSFRDTYTRPVLFPLGRFSSVPARTRFHIRRST